MPTHSERLDLAIQFSDSVERMRRCLSTAGIQIDDDEIVWAWAHYSDTWCAQWLALPDADHELLTILRKHLPEPRKVWQVVVEDAGDGTGDAILVLPNDLLARIGWIVDDDLEIITGSAGTVILRRKERSVEALHAVEKA